MDENAYLPKAELVGQPYVRDSSDEESLYIHKPNIQRRARSDHTHDGIEHEDQRNHGKADLHVHVTFHTALRPSAQLT